MSLRALLSLFFGFFFNLSTDEAADLPQDLSLDSKVKVQDAPQFTKKATIPNIWLVNSIPWVGILYAAKAVFYESSSNT